jgi:hypothetical protein
VDTKLEVFVVPMSGVDRANQFCKELEWREDADLVANEHFHVVKPTLPRAASIIFGTGVTSATPGSIQDLLLAVSDTEGARAEFVERGAQVSEVYHDAGGVIYHTDTEARVPGPDPQHRTSTSFASFNEPDGDRWVLQELSARLPRLEWVGPPADVPAVAEVLRDIEEHHCYDKPTAQKHHWWDWYAAYIVACQQGRSPDEGYHDASAALEATLQ